MSELQGQELLSTRDLAEFYGVSRNIITTMARKGKIPYCQQLFGQYCFDPVVLQEWDPDDEPPNPHQDGQGKFKKDNAAALLRRSSGGGRPSRRKEEKYLKSLSEIVTIEEWEAICLRAVADAKNGDRHARTWISNYLMGRPVTRTEGKLDVTAERKLSAPEQMMAIFQLLSYLSEKNEDIDVPASLAEFLDGLAASAIEAADPRTEPLLIEFDK